MFRLFSPKNKVDKKGEIDDELKIWMKTYYSDLVEIKKAKLKAFNTINRVEEYYEFKSNDPKQNEKNKKKLLEEMGEGILEAWKN